MCTACSGGTDLALAGFTVVSPRTPEEAPLLAAEGRIDAAILGHSVEPEKREALIREIRRISPGCLIVFVYVSPDEATEPLADISLDVTHGPESLIIALYRKLPRPETNAV